MYDQSIPEHGRQEMSRHLRQIVCCPRTILPNVSYGQELFWPPLTSFLAECEVGHTPKRVVEARRRLLTAFRVAEYLPTLKCFGYQHPCCSYSTVIITLRCLSTTSGVSASPAQFDFVSPIDPKATQLCPEATQLCPEAIQLCLEATRLCPDQWQLSFAQRGRS